MSKLLNALGLMKVSEHEAAMNAYRSDWQDVCGRAIQDRDSAEAKFKLAATDLAKQAEEIEEWKTLANDLGAIVEATKDDAQKWRAYLKRSRDRRAGKAVKS